MSQASPDLGAFRDHRLQDLTSAREVAEIDSRFAQSNAIFRLLRKALDHFLIGGLLVLQTFSGLDGQVPEHGVVGMLVAGRFQHAPGFPALPMLKIETR